MSRGNHSATSRPVAFAGHRSGAYEVRSGTISGLVKFLFLLLVAYTACPILEVPGLDLSLSALIFLVLAIQVFFGAGLGRLQEFAGWIILALAVWAGCFLSVFVNAFAGSGGEALGLHNLKMVVRFTYWLLIFVTTIYIASRSEIWQALVKVLIVMITFTSLLRWGEAIFYGKIGAWASTELLTQNMYGILFSTFTPFILVLLFSRQSRRWPAFLVALVVWGAVAINGSRGAYVCVFLGVICFTFLYLLANPGRFAPLFMLLLVCAAFTSALLVAPEKFTRAANERLETFGELDRDKSVSTRKLMVQKGWRLFKEHPFFGVGVGNFAKVSVELETDRIDVSQTRLNRRTSHNSYISWLAETGLAGSIPLTLLLLILAFQGGKAALALARREELWALGIYVSFLMMSLHLFVLSGLTGTSTWVNYGLVAGMVIGAKNYPTQTGSKKASLNYGSGKWRSG